MAGYPDYNPPRPVADPADVDSAVSDYLTANPPLVDSVNTYTGAVVLDSDDVAGPIRMVARVPIPIANLGGTVGSGTVTCVALNSIPTGGGLWLEGQTDAADEGRPRALDVSSSATDDVRRVEQQLRHQQRMPSLRLRHAGRVGLAAATRC